MINKTIRILILLLPFFSLAQQTTSNTIEKNTYKNIITYQPPSEKFIPLTLQTHKGKLRFGDQDSYAIKPDGTFWDFSGAEYTEMDKKTTQLLYGKQGFKELLRMKFLSETYAVIDKEFFTKHSNNMYEKDLNSYTAQQHILKIANFLSTKQELIKNFCNNKTEDCAAKLADTDYYYQGLNHINPWGGKGATEFQQLRKYTSFVNENLETLKKWNQSILPDNTTEGYFVIQVTLDSYDFKNQGYWLKSNKFHINDFFLLRYHYLEPTNATERKLVHPKGVQILHSMLPDKAETFSKKHQKLFLVFNVTLLTKGIHNYKNHELKNSFSLNSPIINLYTDDGLTNKVGEVNINNMNSKTIY